MEIQEAVSRIEEYVENSKLYDEGDIEINRDADNWSVFYIDVHHYAGNGFDTKALLEETGLMATGVSPDSTLTDGRLRLWLTPVSAELNFGGGL